MTNNEAIENYEKKIRSWYIPDFVVDAIMKLYQWFIDELRTTSSEGDWIEKAFNTYMEYNNPKIWAFRQAIQDNLPKPEGDWMKEAFEQFRWMAVFDGNANEIPKYLYTYFKEAIQDNLPKPEGDVVEKWINIWNYFDKVQDCVNKLNKLQELTGEYIDKQWQILTKHLAKDGKWMLRPWEYMKDEFWNIITYEDEQKAGNLIYIVNKQKPL